MEQPVWMLVALEGPHAGSRFAVPATGISFGREADNDLVLTDEKISRRHARIMSANGQLVLEDNKSRNGTFVNNQRVSRVELRDGDRVALGVNLFLIQPATEDTDALPKPDAVEATIVSPRAPLMRTTAIQVGELPPVGGVRVSLGPVSDAKGAIQSPSGSVGAAGAPLEGPGAAPPGELEADGGFPPGLDPSVFSEATGVLPRGVLGQSASGLATPNLFGEPGGGLGARGAGESAGPIFGGAASNLAVSLETSGLAPAGTAPGVMLEPILPVKREGGRGRLLLVGAGVLTLLLIVIAGVASKSPPANPAPEASAGAEPAAPGGAGVRDLLEPSGASADVIQLTPEERALPAEEKKRRAQDLMEQAESFIESNRRKEARDSYDKALAFDPGCELCFIRLNKVKSEIKRDLERYRNDAVRAHSAMDFATAKRNWEKVLEYETDPEGRRSAMEGLQQARQQLQQQPYR